MTHIFLYLLVEHRTMISRGEFCNYSNLVRKADLTRVDVPSEPLDYPLFESNPSQQLNIFLQKNLTFEFELAHNLNQLFIVPEVPCKYFWL